MVPATKQPFAIEKAWGCEKIIYNGADYCGKLLCFNQDASGSLHYHLLKKESWYLQSGKVQVTLIDTLTGELSLITMREGDTITISPGQPHKVKAIKESVIFEVSTTHDDSDTYRITPAMI